MLKYIIAIILIIPLLIVMTPLLLIMAYKPKWFSIKFRYAYVRFLIRWVAFSLRVKHIVDGEENIPSKGRFFITPNHQSFFDALSLICVFKRPITFVAKKETLKMPYIGLIIKVIGGFFLDRTNIRESLKMMKDLEKFMLDNPEVGVIIFPEGTRTRDPLLAIDEFKGGSYKVAYKTMTPVTPTFMTGTPRILTLKWYWIHKVNIRFGKTLSYDEYKDIDSNELAKICHDFSVENLEELHKINDCRKKTA